jgi:hypothetical protein
MLYKIITLHGNLIKKIFSLSYIHIEENGGQWASNLIHQKNNPIAFSSSIPQLLQMNVVDYNTVNNDVNLKLVQEITQFINENNLDHKVDFISNYGLHIANELFFENNAIFAANLSFPIIGQYTASLHAVQGNQNIFGISKDLLQVDALQNDNNLSIALALLGALRWREANSILTHHTGSIKNISAGSIWLCSED